MTPERWQQVDRLLNAVLERDPAGRAEFLVKACGGDDELRREVESLLDFHGRAENFIEAPPAEIAADWLAKNDSREGQTIGHYQLIREIGRGGMGVVYLANDPWLGRQVALKLLLEKLTKDAARVRRFRQEARAVSALNHPNIITVYEVGQSASEPGGGPGGEIGGEHFIVTEFVAGKTLRERFRGGGMAFGVALDVLIQTCAALAAAHEAGIVHRDIKPENIMLRPDGIVKVLDFGLAKLTEQALRQPSASFARVTTQPGVVMGTMSYMSPEQARGLEVDARSDLFSLGVVMYELLTGRAAFAGETDADVLAALLQGEPRPLTRYATRLPEALQNIASQALAKQVEQRYQSAREMADDLRRLKAELEFAAKLEGRVGKDDDILTMTVGAKDDDAEKTTFATHEVGIKTTSFLPPGAQTAPGIFGFLHGGLRRKGKLLAAVTAVAAVVLFGWWKFPAGRQTIDKVAVLPFVNDSGNPQMDYLPDSVTESMIDSLSQLPDLVVMASSTVYAYKGRSIDPWEAGRALKVDAVVTGRVLRQGDQFIVHIEMLRTADGARLWGEKYQGPLDGILAVQGEITREIAGALSRRLNGDEQAQVTKRQTQNSEAYKLYMLGRSQWNKRSGDATRKSIEFFEQAIKHDDRYALAYAGLADAYSIMGSYRLMDPREALPKARAAAEQALKLDGRLAEAHASMGKILTDYDWDQTQAEKEFLLAISLNTNYANAHHWYSSLLASQGRFDEAISEVYRARELDFLAPATNTQVGSILYRARRYDQAIAVLRDTLDLEPDFIAARAYLGLCHFMQRRYDEALAEFHKGREKAPNSSDLVSLLGFTYGLAGQRDKARECLAELNKMAKRGAYVPASNYVGIYAGLGDLDSAFEWMEKSFDERSPMIRGLKTDPVYDILRPDPRFSVLMRRAGLAP